MIQTVEVSVDEHTTPEEPPRETNDAVILSEAALSDWSRNEEEEAWSHLQLAR